MKNRLTIRTILAAVAALLCCVTTTWAFNTWRATLGPLTLTVGEVETVTAFDKPYDVPVTLSNASGQPISVELTAATIDTCRIVDESTQTVTVPAGGTAEAKFRFVAGKGTYSALYPVHVVGAFTGADGKPATVRAVRIISTELPQPAIAGDAAEQSVVAVPVSGGLLLSSLKTQQVAWQYDDGNDETVEERHELPIGWRGSDETSRASFSTSTGITRGETRAAISMHPPYRTRGGSIYAQYRLKLPKSDHVGLNFYNAIRDNSETEPASDGVTFRVWVRPGAGDLAKVNQAYIDTADGDEKLLFEAFTDSKVWLPGDADLTPWAGQTITLLLESHPGPKRNTVCDSSYWGDPVVYVGEMPDEDVSPVTFLPFQLNEGLRADITFGKNGLLDGEIAFGDSNGSAFAFRGLNVSIDGLPVGQWPLGAQIVDMKTEEVRGESITSTYQVRTAEDECQLTIRIEKAGDVGLRVSIKTDSEGASQPGRITAISWGPTSKQAERVYFGHGYCVERPESFRINGGGHSLSTSHVGFDFEGGMSLMMHTSTPPDDLQVDPERNIYTLNVHPETTFTLVPGTNGAMECACNFRELRLAEADGDIDRLRSSGVAKKAGRLVFDNWGGDFAQDNEQLAEAFKYGATDSLVVNHVWQRWGYDVRLPDIWPPIERYGGLEPLQEMSRLCADNGVLFAPHDNYIDFYPDADGYTYDCITFNEQGQPQKAWINIGVNAQSYQWRPDRFQPFLERNLALVKPNLKPTSYFVDVFTSANVFDYYDRDGRFHSRTETQRLWAESFDTIRQTLGDDAPTISEAGDDFLIGHLDGADCQFMTINPEPGRFRLRLECERWSRVPWFDLVNHRTFSLHGVGYSGRYQSGRSRALHGIMSDDYISVEMLTGHAPMVDRGSIVRGSVRKTWLMQPIIRAIADMEIEHCNTIDGDSRLVITNWDDYTERGNYAAILTNRTEQDWKYDKRTFPKYGFLAIMNRDSNQVAETAIERIDGRVVEWSLHHLKDGTISCYLNSRRTVDDAPLAITPKIAGFERIGDRQFKLLVDWDAKQSAPKDLAVFVHIFKPQVSRLKLEGWHAAGGMPSVPTSQWQGTVQTGENWTITVPEDTAPGEYDILVGLFDSKGRGNRYPLLGNEDGQTRYCIGKLIVEGKNGQISDIRMTPVDYDDSLAVDRLVPNLQPVSFLDGIFKISGAARIDVRSDHLLVTTLPGEKPGGTLSIDIEQLAQSTSLALPEDRVTLQAVDHEGNALGESTTIDIADGQLTVPLRTDLFAVKILAR